MSKNIFLLGMICLAAVGCGKDGQNGAMGPQGPAGIQGVQGNPAVVSTIDPCGDAPNIIDEVLLVLSNGQVLASFSDQASGQNTRLVLIPPGTYHTTDGSGCQFVVHPDGAVTF